MPVIFSLFLLILSLGIHAEEIPENEVLTLDDPIPGSLYLEFTDADDLLPKIGDFKIISSLFMSNQLGERWATLTILNQSSSQRLLDRQYIVALFADGEKRHPINIEHTFYGKEQITLTINFGKSKFPVLRTEVRN
ncbi:MAG: hypothetical protein JAZ20_04305 [Candidatus Thiodiazotropha weberae]|nr:hypothetical protein [Candidatus Thiodiazotropha lotti]MCG8013724.1 hypothetical protein [Candidatus Thiodiazotropha lotti]MCG8019617.1 hypothetical protein [Candidatus Thiodiazotropha lotti]MCW4206779.1 hypothetical protein [Candidatus Thiodiazotropha lotti]MCW4213202.1 hypothetical protein [Candidatus Thiodiazotropha lotti]